MKYLFSLLMFSVLLSCQKAGVPVQNINCNMQSVKELNSKKVTISQGVWGTVSLRQGNCMPMVGSQSTTCSECPIKREVRVYAYTTTQDAEPNTGIKSFDGFKTQLIRIINADENGFFQATLPNGKYSVVFVEEGKLYANNFDGFGGISTATINNNSINLNLVLDHAVY